MEKTFDQKMKQIGQVAVFMSLVFFMFIAGAVENAPADINLTQIVSLVGATLVNFGMGIFGISLINSAEGQ